MKKRWIIVLLIRYYSFVNIIKPNIKSNSRLNTNRFSILIRLGYSTEKKIYFCDYVYNHNKLLLDIYNWFDKIVLLNIFHHFYIIAIRV